MGIPMAMPHLAAPQPIKIEFPAAFQPLFFPKRYKIYWGGRGAAKSTCFARALILLAYTKYLRIGCFREFQSSIKDSVHQLLRDQITAMGLDRYFVVTESSIRCLLTKSYFVFKGLHHNATEIKSMEGIDIAWVEEAQLVSKESWEILDPTIRKANSEIWVSFNPIEETDPTYDRFVLHPQPESFVVKVSWRDNPWFPETLNRVRLGLLQTDPDAYEHVWEGSCRIISEAVILRGRYDIHTWSTPHDPLPNFHHGIDFGFAMDPTCAVRCYTTEEKEWERTNRTIVRPGTHLWIDREACKVGLEIDETNQYVDERIPTFATWPSYGDSSRPETISYLRRHGWNIEPSEKWTGIVEDAIAHLKGFVLIHIHATNCPNTQQEARLWKYKVDRVTGRVLPQVVDANNHSWDSWTYSMNRYIQRRGVDQEWANL